MGAPIDSLAFPGAIEIEAALGNRFVEKVADPRAGRPGQDKNMIVTQQSNFASAIPTVGVVMMVSPFSHALNGVARN